MKNNNEKIIPIVFATDDNYFPLLNIAIESMLEHCNKSYKYNIYILQTSISEENKKNLQKYTNDNFNIEYIDVTEQLDKIGTSLHLRDYYTNTIYYRIFIPTLFPQYQKALYLDCDIVFKDDVAKLFNIDITDYLLGVVEDDVIPQCDAFVQYVEKALGVRNHRYFNSGILLMNLDACRKYRIENKFVNLLSQFKFICAPDQDYLNTLCKDKVLYLDRGWNKSPLPQADFDDKTIKIIHYKMDMKPWHKSGIKFEDDFWRVAKKTCYYNHLMEIKNNFGEKELEKEKIATQKLIQTALDDANNPNNYFNTIKKRYLSQDNVIPFEKINDVYKLNIEFNENDKLIKVKNKN